MKPFEIAIELKSSILVGRNAVRLDGLLWHCLFLYYHDQDKAREELAQFLTLHETSEFYHASSMQFGILGSVGSNQGEIYDNVLATSRATVGSMRQGTDLSPDKFKPNGRNGKYTKLNLSGIPYKSRLTKHDTHFSRYVVFHGHGKADEIADLIQFYVPAIGVNANIGFGTIGKVHAREVSNDLSLISLDGTVSRSIPTKNPLAKQCASARIAPAILIPPFRNQDDVMCVVPERIRKFKMTMPE